MASLSLFLIQLFIHDRRTSVEESSHSTPSPMSSAASSQDSLHRGAGMPGGPYGPYHHLMVGTTSPMPAQGGVGLGMHSMQANKKQRGVKSTLGRIFGSGKKVRVC